MLFNDDETKRRDWFVIASVAWTGLALCVTVYLLLFFFFRGAE